MLAILEAMKRVMKAGAIVIGNLVFISKKVGSRDCSRRDVLMEVLIIRWKKELWFRKSRFIDKKT
jgi:hypothetical protein